MLQYFDFLRSFINKDFRSFSFEDLKTFNLTITFCIVALIVFPVFMLVHYLMNDLQGSFFILCISLVFGSCILILKFSKSTRLVGNVGTFLFFCLTTFFGFTQGGFESTSLIPKIATPIIAYILIGKRSAIFWLTLEIFSISCFYFLSISGYQFPHTIPENWIDFDRYLQLIASLFTLFVLFMYSETSRVQILKELQKERERSEFLLYNTLPKHIALRLKDEKKQIADYFPNCTVLFADLVGFTALSTTKSPSEIVHLLDRIFSEFDALTAKYNIEKIKTIGDCYMAVVGIQDTNNKEKTNHLSIVQFAFSMMEAINNINREVGFTLQIRIGISSGEVVAGVIGFEKLAYDLWGDTVNTASRMESHGIPGLIHCSESTYHLLKDQYSFIENNDIFVKGKGKMKTYFITEPIGQ